jgi:hypothetical protein
MLGQRWVGTAHRPNTIQRTFRVRNLGMSSGAHHRRARLSWLDWLVSDRGGWLDGFIIRHDLNRSDHGAAGAAGEVVPGVGIQ